MIQVQPEINEQRKVNFIQIHNSKPFVLYGLVDGLVVCNYIQEGSRILQFKEENLNASKALFLQRHQAIATFSKIQNANETIMKIWSLKINSEISIQGNQISLAAKSHLKFNLLGIKYNQHMLVLISLNKIYFFSIQKLEIIKIVEVLDNKRGLLSLTSQLSPGLAAVPDQIIGTFRILNLFKYEKSIPIKAHKTQLTNILITQSGVRVATTSAKANTVRIFSTNSKVMLQEILLDNIGDQILSIKFSQEADWMVLCTKDGKLRILVANLDKQQDTSKFIQLENPKQSLNFLSFLFQSFGRQLPFAQYDSGQEVKAHLCIMKFEQNNDIVMAYTETLTQFNKVIFLRFDPINGGVCSKRGEISLK